MVQVQKSQNMSGTVLKALDALEFIADSTDAPRISDIARACNMSRPTASRLVRTLEARGLVGINDDGGCRLGPSILTIAGKLMNQLHLPSLAQPHMQKLTDACRETTHLAIRDNNDVLYVAKVDSPESVRMHSATGSRAFLHSTALGKVLLAWMPEEQLDAFVRRVDLVPRTDRTITDPDALLEHLAEVRAKGYAIDDIENEEGIRCVGAPLFSHSGDIVAAISFSGPTFRVKPDVAKRYVPDLLLACKNVSEELGFDGFGSHKEVGEERGR